MKRNQKIFYCLVLASAIVVGAISAQNISASKLKPAISEESSYSLTLNSSRKPTLTDGTGTLQYNDHSVFTYTNASDYESGHVTLNKDGELKKDRSNGLTSFQAKFTGTLTLFTAFDENDEFWYETNLVSETKYQIEGNFFKLKSLVDSTNIESLTVCYNCGDIATIAPQRIEAETANLIGTASSGPMKKEPVCFHNYIAHDNTSGDYALYAYNNAGNTVTYKIDSNKDASAIMYFRQACRLESKKPVAKKVTDLAPITLNDVAITSDAQIVPVDSTVATGDYYEFHLVKVATVELKKGINTLQLTATTKSTNIDFIDFLTDATLVNKSETLKHDDCAKADKIAVLPTKTTVGTCIIDCCKYCKEKLSVSTEKEMPVLTDAGYTYDEENNKYSITLDEHKFEFTYAPKVTSRFVEDCYAGSKSETPDFFTKDNWSIKAGLTSVDSGNGFEIKGFKGNVINDRIGVRFTDKKSDGKDLTNKLVCAYSNEHSSISPYESKDKCNEVLSNGYTFTSWYKTTGSFGITTNGQSKVYPGSTDIKDGNYAISIEYNKFTQKFSVKRLTKSASCFEAESNVINLLDNAYHKIDIYNRRVQLSGSTDYIQLFYVYVDDNALAFNDIGLTETVNSEFNYGFYFETSKEISEYVGNLGFFCGNTANGATDTNGTLYIHKNNF